jgi:stage IV sporulation protein FB
MSLSWKIARLFGIDVHIHWTFWFLPAWAMLMRAESGEPTAWWLPLLLIGCMFVFVVMHELGHALTARRFGIATRSITLCPLGGIAQLEHMPRRPWEEFCIAIAGPLVNVALALVLGAGILVGLAFGMDFWASDVAQFAGFLVILNVMMFGFNLLPAFPMDGGRVLRAILATVMDHLDATRVAVAVGTVVAVMLALAGIFLPDNPYPWVILIAVFVILAGRQELKMLERDEQYRRAREEDALVVPQLPRAILCIWDPQRGEWVPQ